MAAKLETSVDRSGEGDTDTHVLVNGHQMSVRLDDRDGVFDPEELVVPNDVDFESGTYDTPEELSDDEREPRSVHCGSLPGHGFHGIDLDKRFSLTTASGMASGVNYHRISISAGNDSKNTFEGEHDLCHFLVKALQMREKYMAMSLQNFCQISSRALHKYDMDFNPVTKFEPEYPGQLPSASAPYKPFSEPDIGDCGLKFEMKQGVVCVFENEDDQLAGKVWSKMPNIDLKTFVTDMNDVFLTCVNGPLKSLCYRRLSYLESCFHLHALLNERSETVQQQSVSHRDFYNVRKVDTHVHAASCMNQKHLLRFIKKKMKVDPNARVIIRDGQELTLSEVFESLSMTSYDLNVDKLDVHADRSTFHRFDKFNLKYNPVGESRLREIFLKTDNHIKGRYFAQLLKEVMCDLEDSKYQKAELRISIYGRSRDEWHKLAEWACMNQVYSDHVRWLIQVPRL
jgi:AMP deaminase